MTISYKNKLSELIPTFQSGVYLTCISDSKAFLGNIYSSLEIFDQNLIQLLKCLDGTNTLADIAQGCNLSVDQLVQILEPFEKKKLIVFQATTQDVAIAELIKSENLMQSELGEKILAKRIIGELDSVTLDRLYARSTFQIMIFGKNRLALNLLGLLQSIGFSQSQHFALPFFICIFYACIFCSVLNFNYFIFNHESFHDFKNLMSDIYFCRVTHFHDLFYSRRT
mgnify:CR=1 FL=1